MKHSFGKNVGSCLAAAAAFGVVTAGYFTGQEAQAANQNWSYYHECGLESGCDSEEKKEYYYQGSYRQEVIYEPGPNNKEEMLELSSHSEFWCSQLLSALYGQGFNVPTTWCYNDYDTTLGWP